MTAAIIMPDRPERHPGNSGDPGVWISPSALAQLFSFHVIKDLNFLSQVIKLSVAETLQPGILTKVQLKSQGSPTESSLGLAAEGVNSILLDNEDTQLNCQPSEQPAPAVINDTEEDWDTELSTNPPTVQQLGWDDNPRMLKLYKKKRELEIERQKEREEEIMEIIENSEAEGSRSSQGTWDGDIRYDDVVNANPAKQLDMNKVMKGGKKLFVRNINFRTTQHKLWEFFKKFGRVRACELMKDRYTRRSRGIAFVTFDKQEECEKALSSSGEELTLHDWVLEIELARPRKNDPKSDVRSEFENTSKDLKAIDDEAGPPACDILTDDAFLHIFSFLEIRQLINCERVCTKWRKLALQAWKSLPEISLYDLMPAFYSVDDRALRSMLSKCSPNLTTLDLSVSARSLTDRSLEAIARFCPNVQNIHLVSLRITNRGFEKFVKSCNKIEKIEMEQCDDVREDGIWRLFNCCRDLREVHLNNCKRLSGQCFHVMAGGVVTLSLTGCSKLQDVGMSKLSMRCKNLQELHLNGCNLLTDAALQNLAKNEVTETLQILSLNRVYPQMSPEGLRPIAEFVNLQELYLSENNLVRDETLQRIYMACTSLKVLDIGGCGSRITDSGLDKLPSSVENLTISHLSSITDEGLEIVAENCSNLASLKARFCHDISDAGVVSVITLCSHLRELDICGCFRVTNTSVDILIEEQKLHDPPQESVIVMAGGTSIDPSKLTLPPSITLNTFIFSPTAPDFDAGPFYFDSDEEDSSEDDLRDWLDEDEAFLASEMEMS